MLKHMLAIILTQKWKYLPVVKINRKMCFRWSAFTTMLLHITNDFHGLDLEFYKPRMNAEFRVMIGELYLKSN